MRGEAAEPVLGICAPRLLFRLDRGRERDKLAVALGHRVPARGARGSGRGATQRPMDQQCSPSGETAVRTFPDRYRTAGPGCLPCHARLLYSSVETSASRCDVTQISANISPETRDRLERYVRARGMKKGFVIEQALLHHLQAINEIPEDIVIPPRLVVTAASGERLLERLESQEAPNRAMRELFGEDPEPAHSDPS